MSSDYIRDSKMITKTELVLTVRDLLNEIQKVLEERKVNYFSLDGCLEIVIDNQCAIVKRPYYSDSPAGRVPLRYADIYTVGA